VNKVPTSFGIIAKRGKSVWQLERSDFALGSSFNDDDALKMRIHETLSMASHESFLAHRRRFTKETGFQGVHNYSPLRLPSDWRAYFIEREKNSGKVVAVSSETSSGQLRALLDDNKEIQAVTVNGKVDDEWATSLAAANRVRARRYSN